MWEIVFIFLGCLIGCCHGDPYGLLSMVPHQRFWCVKPVRWRGVWVLPGQIHRMLLEEERRLKLKHDIPKQPGPMVFNCWRVVGRILQRAPTLILMRRMRPIPPNAVRST